MKRIIVAVAFVLSTSVVALADQTCEDKLLTSQVSVEYLIGHRSGIEGQLVAANATMRKLAAQIDELTREKEAKDDKKDDKSPKK